MVAKCEVGGVGWWWGLNKEAPAFDENGSIIKEAVFIYGMNFWLHLKMEPILIFMMPTSGPYIKRQNMFWPSNLQVFPFF